MSTSFCIVFWAYTVCICKLSSRMSYQLPNKNQASLTHFLLVIYLRELYGNILLGIEALIMNDSLLFAWSFIYLL